MVDYSRGETDISRGELFQGGQRVFLGVDFTMGTTDISRSGGQQW